MLFLIFCFDLFPFAACFAKQSIEVTVSAAPERVLAAQRVVVPGVGAFGAVMAELSAHPGLVAALTQRLRARRPTLLICAALQILGTDSEESPGVAGLAVVPLRVQRFPAHCTVPQQAWSLVLPRGAEGGALRRGHAFYSNSYCFQAAPLGWEVAESVHGGVSFVAALQAGGVLAVQFHPELSGVYGAESIAAWYRQTAVTGLPAPLPEAARPLCRVVCCMDVKEGRVVKGVRFQNLADAGDPASLALEYERQGCDELVILDVSATVEGRATAINVVRACRAKCSL